jgi:hypothetical protein
MCSVLSVCDDDDDDAWCWQLEEEMVVRCLDDYVGQPRQDSAQQGHTTPQQQQPPRKKRGEEEEEEEEEDTRGLRSDMLRTGAPTMRRAKHHDKVDTGKNGSHKRKI